ncbi:MAG: hypothetical protein ABW252_11965 [Polyangiales bacterium]
MVMQHVTRRSWKLGLALASLVSFGACADVDAMDGSELEGDVEDQEDLAQLFPRADAGTTTATAEGDLGVGNGRDVVMIGDSWMNLGLLGLPGDGIQKALNDTGKRYRGYGIPGVKMLTAGAFGPAIPTQWPDALRQGRDIKTVIMTGGGNDVLLGGAERADCPRGGPRCQELIGKITQELKALWEKMAAAGVKDVVYIGYSENSGDGQATPEITNTKTNGTGEACLAMTSLRCTPIDTTPIIAKNDLKADKIHPVQPANNRIAAEVLKVMEEKGIRR